MAPNKNIIDLSEIIKPELFEPFTDFKIVESDGLKFVRLDFGQIKPDSSLNFPESTINNILLPMFNPPDYYKLITYEEMKDTLKNIENWLIEEEILNELTQQQLTEYFDNALNYGLFFYNSGSCKDFDVHKYWKFIALMAVTVLVDDAVDNTTIICNLKSISKYFNQSKSLLLKSDGLREDDIDLLVNKVPSRYQKFLRALLNLLVELQNVAGNATEKRQSLYKCARQGYYALQAHALLKVVFEEDEPIPESVFRCFRTFDNQQVSVYWEAICCSIGVATSEEIEESIVFKQLMSTADEISSLFNDLTGLKRDLCKTLDHKSLVIWLATNTGVTLEEATAKAVQHLRKLTIVFSYLANKLLEIFEGTDQEAESKFVVEHCKTMLDAAGYLIVHVTRYGNLREYFTIKQN